MIRRMDIYVIGYANRQETEHAVMLKVIPVDGQEMGKQTAQKGKTPNLNHNAETTPSVSTSTGKGF